MYTLPALPTLRTELLSQGWTRRALERALTVGDLRYVLRGVLLDATVDETLTVRAHAAGLLLPSGSVLARRTAAWTWGADVLPPGAHLELPQVDVVGPRGRNPSRRAEISGRAALLPPEDIACVNGLLLTTPLRTALDLGRLCRRAEALVALDALTHAGLVTVDELTRAAHGPELVHQRGVRQLRELVAWVEPLTESPGESRTRLHLLDAGLPRPEAQIKIYDLSGRFIARIDLGYRARRVAVEFDGEADHTTPEDCAYDAARRGDAERLGWRFVVARKGDAYGNGWPLLCAVAELIEIEPHRPRRT